MTIELVQRVFLFEHYIRYLETLESLKINWTHSFGCEYCERREHREHGEQLHHNVFEIHMR
jgi:hypothetical protein